MRGRMGAAHGSAKRRHMAFPCAATEHIVGGPQTTHVGERRLESNEVLHAWRIVWRELLWGQRQHPFHTSPPRGTD